MVRRESATADTVTVRSYLAEVQGRPDAFVTFTGKESSRFIQFASMNDGESFFGNIPSEQVNPDQPGVEDIRATFPEFESSDIPQGTDFNCQCELSEAVTYTDRFFSELAGASEGIELDITVHLGESACTICRSTVSDDELEVVEVDADQLRTLGVPEDAITEELEVMKAIHRDELAAEGDYSGDELDEAVEEMAEDLLFVTVCEACSLDI